VVGARTSLRASLPDRNPYVGMVRPGTYALGGLGARGFVLAPLLGEMLAAVMLGRPAPMENELMRCVSNRS